MTLESREFERVNRPESSSREEIESKLFALAIIHGTGAFFAFLIHVYARKNAYELEGFPSYAIMGFLTFLIILSFLLSLLCRGIRTILFQAVRLPTIGSFEFPMQRLLITVRVFAFFDFVGITFFILWTGGSDQSFFAPFLFLITPVVILLDVIVWWEILIFAVISIGIYSFSMASWTMAHIPYTDAFKVESHRGIKVCLVLTTTLCFAFPLAFSILEGIGRRSSGVTAPRRPEIGGRS